jgi:L-ribulose-5-phosphate 3-epimerase
MSEHNGLALGTANFGYFYRRELEGSLRDIADAGYTRLELSLGPPHIDLSDFGADDRRSVKNELRRLGLEAVSTNAIELNPISLNDDLKEATYRQYRAAIELTAEIEGESVVMITGRRNPLIPMPEERAKDLLRAQLERLLPVAQSLGVTIALEPVPFGFLQTAREVAPFVRELRADRLGITLDCANCYFAGADPGAEVAESGELTTLAHISDTWRSKFAHTRVGTAEVDFAGFASALRESGFAGTTVYELVDGEDPAPRLRADRSVLSDWGWG